MLDIQINLKPNNTETSIPSANDKSIANENGNFAQLLDDVKNCYEASTKLAEEQGISRNESLLAKIKNIFSNNKKEENTDKQKNNENKELPVTTEQLLLNSQLALISSITGRNIVDNSQQTPQTTENNDTGNLIADTENLSENTQNVDVMSKMLDELKNTQAVKTQTPLKTNDIFVSQTENKNSEKKVVTDNIEKVEIKHNTDKQTTAISNTKSVQETKCNEIKEINNVKEVKNVNEIKVIDKVKETKEVIEVKEIKSTTSTDYVKNIDNKTLVKISSFLEERNIKVENGQNNRNSQTLQNIKNEDIEITSVENSKEPETQADTYDFNSSSFDNLSSHLTKLSLNKTADFSKVLDNKIMKNAPTTSAKAVESQPLKPSGSVSLVIRPDNLGRVNVNLTSSNGVVSAELIAESQQAADTLNKNIDELKQNLLEQGIKVGDVNVKVTQASQSETFNNDKHFRDNLTSSQQNTFGKQQGKTGTNANSGNQNDYTKQNIEDENISDNTEYSQTNRYNTNKNLEIYNNMGRTL